MRRRPGLAVVIAVIGLSTLAAGQGQVRQQGRAIVEYRSPAVIAVAAYEYARRHHDGEWLLIEFAVQAKQRIAFHRDDISVLTPEEQRIPVASQQEFLDAHAELKALLQNAIVYRRPLGPYFRTPLQPTIRFFAYPGRIVHDEAISNPDEVASGDLLFRAPGGRWPAGTYRLVFDHEKAKAELPIRLE